MALFKPFMMRERLTDLSCQTLEDLGIKGLLLDVDNTLSRHFDDTPFDGIREFVEKMKKKGMITAHAV